MKITRKYWNNHIRPQFNDPSNLLLESDLIEFGSKALDIIEKHKAVKILRDIVTVITIAMLMVASYYVGTIKDTFLPSGTDSGSQDAGSVLIYPHDAYLDAIEWVESKGDANAKGDFKDGVYRAIGSFQLWEIYVRDFRRIEKLNGMPHSATYSDRWNPVKSRKITAVVTSHYANHDWQNKPHTQLQWIETAVRAHKCPTDRNKESTKKYWLKVKARMEKVRIVE